jgi:hypothetical protein
LPVSDSNTGSETDIDEMPKGGREKHPAAVMMKSMRRNPTITLISSVLLLETQKASIVNRVRSFGGG